MRLFIIFTIICLTVALIGLLFFRRNATPSLPAPTNSSVIDHTPIIQTTQISGSQRQVPESIREGNQVLATLLDPAATKRTPSDFSEQVPSVSSDLELAAVRALVLDALDSDTPRNEGINILRSSQFPGLEDDLMTILTRTDDRPRFRAFAVQHLGASLEKAHQSPGEKRVWSPVKARSLLYELLADPEVEVRREALLALTRIQDQRASETVLTGLSNPAWESSKDLIIRCAGELNMRSLLPQIRPLAYSEDLVVRVAALNTLSGWRDVASRPAMEEAKQSKITRLRHAGEVALFEMDKPEKSGNIHEHNEKK